MTPLEIAANAVTTVSVLLAARNHVQTWSTGIIGCVLFVLVFFEARLYADATLQLFFIATSVIGWWHWHWHRPASAGRERGERPVTRVRPRSLAWMALAAAVVTLAYGGLLHRFTDAYMPYIDAAVLALSVVAQCLLMLRKLETWPGWLFVNTLSVPLFASRGLWLTAALYAAYWFNAWYGWARWRGGTRAAVQAAA
ncbi:MAG TPA: nicotinamide riboside transporter PnuC [Burkholderiaceae bacterium]